jgi:hypothetical protein
VRINLNFLSQSKQIELKLNKMVMCSQQEQEKWSERILELERENAVLRGSGREGLLASKLTLPFALGTFNTLSYRFSNFIDVEPLSYARMTNLFLEGGATEVPQSGQVYFNILVTQLLHSPKEPRPYPFIELGVRSEEH